MTSPQQKLVTPSRREIAYHQTPGVGMGVVFCGGFMSDMTGSKALALESWCAEVGRPYVRFDYSGHGASSGRFEDGTIGDWAEDAAAIITALTDGPQVIVGSSMGGWISLLIARALPDRVAGLVGIAAAPDFTERMWTDDLEDHHRRSILAEGRVEIPTDYGSEPYVFTKALFDDGRAQSILSAPLAIAGPVRLLQGMADPDVPWETAVTLAEHLDCADCELVLVKGGDHRLSTDNDLARLKRVVGEVLTRIDSSAETAAPW